MRHHLFEQKRLAPLGIAIMLLIIIFSRSSGYTQILVAPEGLTCEFLRNPSDAVITDPVPEFSWIFPQYGGMQTAYQILVASTLQDLNEGSTDLWDSGKVNDNHSVNISYSGTPLRPNTSMWWQVRVWSSSGDSSFFSVPQQVHLGEFDRSGVDYPGQSRWVELAEDQWVSEDRQCAHFVDILPEKFFINGDGNYFIEFPRAAFGTLLFYADSKSDHQQVEIFLGERKSGDEVHKVPGVSNIGFVGLKMDLMKGLHVYRVRLPERPPSRYLHSQELAGHYPEIIPFRYAEFKVVGEVKIISVRQEALFYHFDDTASDFQCSDSRLKDIWDLSKYTLKATPFLGVYADGNRERMPYEADAYIQQLSHYAVDREYAIAEYTLGFLLDHASWPTEWQMHTVLMAWQHYMYTADLEFLKSRYDDLKRKTLYQLTESNGLISTRRGKKTRSLLDSLHFPGPLNQFRDIVDWPQGPAPGREPQSNQSPVPGGETDGYVFTDYNTVVNAFHNRSLHILAEIALLVGRGEDHRLFTQRALEHEKAFVEYFLDKERGIFRDGDSTDHASLHANMFALAFNLVPDPYKRPVIEFVKSRGMACSVYGAQYLLESLFNAGEARSAIGLLTADGKRSWMNMINSGATMTTEAWDEYYKPNLTWNHAWGASPANIIVRKLFGIEPLEPAFAVFRIQPQPGDLDFLSIKTPTVRGEIFCELKNEGNRWEMRLSIPGNSVGKLQLPEEFNQIMINGSPGDSLEKSGGILLEPGIYHITCQ